MRDDVANSRKKVPGPRRNVLTVPMHAQRQPWPPPRLMPQRKDFKLQANHAACRCCSHSQTSTASVAARFVRI